MKKLIIIIVSSVLAMLLIAGVLTWYFLCVKSQGIFVGTMPQKVTYWQNEEFEIQGLTIYEKKKIEKYNKQIPLDKVKITGFDSTKPSEKQEITVTFGKYHASFYVEIKELPPEQKAVIKIQLQAEEGYEIKTTYYCSEPLEIEHMRLLVTYSDNSTELIPVLAEYVSGFDNCEPEENQEVRITYGGFFTRLKITILQNEITE